MLQKGFTLIELMIVVAIIGILSMFALPAYQDYTKRTYVSEGMALATAAKLAATETFATSGTWPTSNTAAGLPNASLITGQSVAGIEIISGTSYSGSAAKVNATAGNMATIASVTNILIHYNQKVTGSTAQNTYASGAGNGVLAIVPVLFTTAADQGSVKWACQARTTNVLIEPKWLPANCRTEAH